MNLKREKQVIVFFLMFIFPWNPQENDLMYLRTQLDISGRIP